MQCQIGNFILTVTRFIPETEKENIRRKKIHIKRKTVEINAKKTIYSFETFEEFCAFCNYLNEDLKKKMKKFANNISLHLYKEKYYLVFTEIHVESDISKTFFSIITEFGHFVNTSELFERKLLEYGKVIIPKNAINVCDKHFC